ncbi:sce7725 family protein [Companilactobacillus halodurans]|uniref:Sce7725 family protein n=1 Tax=Companilactobacillus halodurans TaxID=2584183 RepID=A0A5P0ZWZ7_9LACO|nr:sce7725 family protein [Companilactobacillus halodurans]MQS75383.1 sce7725 family protein [Companilactobacillus halodurans]MQS97328.1 sce7725 family protein [Companilactobacillus halodurans]
MTYYPYLRGRMYDLLALKELCENRQLSFKIVPIIEPVRDSKELLQTVQTFIKYQQPFGIVANPQVSVYGLNDTKLYPLPDMRKLSFFHPSAILAADFSSDFLKTVDNQESLLIVRDYQMLLAYQKTKVLHTVDKVLIPDVARIHRLVPKKAVKLSDPLTFVRHVEDYQLLNDEFFEPADWYRQVDDYHGFGDYSMVGHVYFDKGMPARAISLHLIYVTEDGTLRIHHFVSDSNEKMSGQKQKFFEALNKMVIWCDKNINGLNLTPALTTLLEYRCQDKFPGLGIIKKLSLMHHFQLMGRLLELKQ